MATNLEYILVGVSGRPEGLTFVFTTPREGSGTSISGGDGGGNFHVSPHSPVIICAKKASYYTIFLPFNSTNYENSLFNGFI